MSAGDARVQENTVRRVILVSGKHYYALEKHREILGVQDVAIVRVESLCPFPVAELNEEIQKYKHVKSKYNTLNFVTNCNSFLQKSYTN